MKTIAIIKHLDVFNHITSCIASGTINYVGSLKKAEALHREMEVTPKSYWLTRSVIQMLQRGFRQVKTLNKSGLCRSRLPSTNQ